jgi:hypothetical protein
LSEPELFQYFGYKDPHHFWGNNIGEFIGLAARGTNLGKEFRHPKETPDESLLGD